MIDTVRVRFPTTPTPSQLEAWDKRTTTKATGMFHERFTYNAKLTQDQVSIRCTYLPFDFDGNPMTTIELSLPKAVFGNNFTMIRDIPTAIDRANHLLSKIDALPPLDLRDGILIRIDPCYNHLVGPLVPDYVNAIGHLEYPHRRTKHHRNEGAEFRAKHVTTKFYDKMRETSDPTAYGILRQETTFLKPKRISKLVGKKHPTLLDITPAWLAAVLLDDLEKLRLDGRPILTRDTSLVTLCQAYGSYAGIYYWGLLLSKLDSSKPRLRQRTKLHPRSLDRHLHKIADAGIALTLTESTEPLPPLRIDL